MAYSLEDVLANTKGWDYNYPVIVPRYKHEYELPRDIHVFIDRIKYTCYKGCRDLIKAVIRSLNPGFVIAGDSACAALIQYSVKTNFDIFVIGEIGKKLHNLDDEIKTVDLDMKLNYGKDCWVWSNDNYTIKAHTYSFESIDDLLQNFDIDAAAVAFDGNRLYFTEDSMKTYTTCKIMLNLEKRRKRYESRLCDYFEYGFSIVMPNLNINPDDNKCFTFKYLGFTMQEVEGSIIYPVSRLTELGQELKFYLCGSRQIITNVICQIANDQSHPRIMPSEEEIQKFYEIFVTTIKDGTCTFNMMYKCAPRPILEHLCVALNGDKPFTDFIDIAVKWIMEKAQKCDLAAPVSPFNTREPLSLEEWYGKHYKAEK
jgi:hypothetical protein